ncbi:Uncharacterised protein [Candidatus Burarchaeum australiense]|nr:Uncharacterised protein [Candidatus Burarchaeum australiense]
MRQVARKGSSDSKEPNTFELTGRLHQVHEEPNEYWFRFGGPVILAPDEARKMGGLVREEKEKPSGQKTGPSKEQTNFYTQFMDGGESIEHKLRRLGE